MTLAARQAAIETFHIFAEEAVTIADRLLADYYESNWECAAMHWSPERDWSEELVSAVFQALVAPARTLEDAVRAWEPAAQAALTEISSPSRP